MTMTSSQSAAVTVSADDYTQVCNFLAYEARLLDDNRLWDWWALLAEDFHYIVPVRIALRRAEMIDDPVAEFNSGVAHVEDTKNTAKVRIERLGTGWAWAEDPASRTSRSVSSVAVAPRNENEFDVTSSLLLYRERGLEPHHQIIAGNRSDVLRRTAGGFEIVKRAVYLAHTTLTTPNLALFL